MYRFTFSATLMAIALAAAEPAKADLVNDCTYEQDHAKAIEYCTKAIRSGEWSGAELAWAYTNRAIAKYHIGRPRDALADYDQALSLDPDYSDAYFGKGQAFCNIGETKEALAWYVDAVSAGAWKADDAQRFLKEEGHYHGDVTGVFDLATERGLGRWARLACR